MDISYYKENREKKETFLICKDWILYTDNMSMEEKGILFDTILRYQNGIEITELPSIIKVIFPKIKKFFDDNELKYIEKIKERNIRNGSKGGRPKKIENKEKSKKNIKEEDKVILDDILD